ncbi:MAG: hypothetical protein V4710_04880 [Verrucomicrobiota bacterium]
MNLAFPVKLGILSSAFQTASACLFTFSAAETRIFSRAIFFGSVFSCFGDQRKVGAMVFKDRSKCQLRVSRMTFDWHFSTMNRFE